MKRLFTSLFVFLVVFASVCEAQTIPRFGDDPARYNNTGVNASYGYTVFDDGEDSISVTPTDYRTVVVNESALSSNVAVHITNSGVYTGDILVFMLTADGTNRTVSFGTNLSGNPDSVIVLADKTAVLQFINLNGTFIELSRLVDN